MTTDGFFGITLVLYPKIHTVNNGLFTNPLAYWQTISDETEVAFRLAGAGFLTLVMGPFFDEIFGGVGVKMMAFAREMLFINTLLFFFFLYYSFYAPLGTAVTLIWQCQAILSGLILGANICEVTGASLKSYYVAFVCLEFGGFSLALMSIPNILFGPPSPVAYWKTWSDLAMLTGRSLGIGMFLAFVLGYYYFSKNDGFVKMLTVWNFAITALTAIPAFYGGAESVSSMWLIQFAFQIPSLIVGLYLELTGKTGDAPAPSIKCPTLCGLNIDTYLFVNLMFYFPFVGIFLTVPNQLVGPNNPMGPQFAMFTSELDEVALWFGKSWAVAIFLVAMSPYAFGFDKLKVTKMLTLGYLMFNGLFAYALIQLDVFNLLMMGPLTGVNVLFFVVGLYLVLNSGGSVNELFMA